MFLYQQLVFDLIGKHLSEDVVDVLEIGGVPTHEDSIAKRLNMRNHSVTQINLRSDLEEKKYDGVQFRSMDANKTTFQDSSFDLIYGTAVLEHLNSFDVFLEEMHRILKKNGILILHGGPLWNSYWGHHLWVHMEGVKYEFNGNNPIPDWGQLLYSKAEMTELLIEKNLPIDHVNAIIKMIYESKTINRLTYSDLVNLFMRGKFQILEIQCKKWKKPSKELKSKNELINDFGEMFVVLSK